MLDRVSFVTLKSELMYNFTYLISVLASQIFLPQKEDYCHDPGNPSNACLNFSAMCTSIIQVHFDDFCMELWNDHKENILLI